VAETATSVGYEQRVTSRRVRLVLDVEMRAAEITRLRVYEHFARRDGGVPRWAWGWAARQNRLLRAILSDAGLAGPFLGGVARGELGAALGHEWLRAGLREGLEAVVGRACAGLLGAEDAARFLEAWEAGKLVEEVGLMYGNVEADWRRAELREVTLLPEEA
jgi:hypothetical protein